MITAGVVVFFMALGFLLVVMFGWGRGKRTPRQTHSQEGRVEEIHHASERYRATAAHLEIRAAELSLIHI